jgi:hypothetical protein
MTSLFIAVQGNSPLWLTAPQHAMKYSIMSAMPSGEAALAPWRRQASQVMNLHVYPLQPASALRTPIPPLWHIALTTDAAGNITQAAVAWAVDVATLAPELPSGLAGEGTLLAAAVVQSDSAVPAGAQPTDSVVRLSWTSAAAEAYVQDLVMNGTIALGGSTGTVPLAHPDLPLHVIMSAKPPVGLTSYTDAAATGGGSGAGGEAIALRRIAYGFAGQSLLPPLLAGEAAEAVPHMVGAVPANAQQMLGPSPVPGRAPAVGLISAAPRYVQLSVELETAASLFIGMNGQTPHAMLPAVTATGARVMRATLLLPLQTRVSLLQLFRPPASWHGASSQQHMDRVGLLALQPQWLEPSATSEDAAFGTPAYGVPGGAMGRWSLRVVEFPGNNADIWDAEAFALDVVIAMTAGTAPVDESQEPNAVAMTWRLSAKLKDAAVSAAGAIAIPRVLQDASVQREPRLLLLPLTCRAAATQSNAAAPSQWIAWSATRVPGTCFWNVEWQLQSAAAFRAFRDSAEVPEGAWSARCGVLTSNHAHSDWVAAEATDYAAEVLSYSAPVDITTAATLEAFEELLFPPLEFLAGAGPAAGAAAAVESSGEPGICYPVPLSVAATIAYATLMAAAFLGILALVYLLSRCQGRHRGLGDDNDGM